MQFSLFISLFYLLLPLFALAHEADQIVLGDLRSFKLFEPSPTASPELSPIETETTPTITHDDVQSAPQITLPTSSFAGPGTANGPTCVQTCLARAASQVGCGGSANFWCVCRKGAYVGKAWDCFGASGCPGDAIGRALADLTVACAPYTRRGIVAGSDGPQMPMVTPEGTPIAGGFNSSWRDEL